MTFEQVLQKLRTKLANADTSVINGKLAIQVNMTGKNSAGTLYIEVKDGVLSVEPYEYIDKDALFIVSSDALLKMVNGKMDPVGAYERGTLKIEGNVDKALEFKKLIG